MFEDQADLADLAAPDAQPAAEDHAPPAALEDQLSPRDRAQADAQAAAEDYGRAAVLNETAAKLNSISDSLTTMGYGEAGNAMGREATREIVAASHDVAQAVHLTTASNSWNAVADDLDLQAKARGEAYVAAAGHRQAEDILHQPLSEADRTHAEVAAAAAAALETTLGHRADQLGHDAASAATTALDEEAKARGIHE